jgi:hypothetical protein
MYTQNTVFRWNWRSKTRMLKKAVQQGHSERRPEAYPLGYVEDLNDARTMLVDFFSILRGKGLAASR